jgi:hypothetical protein
MMTTMTNWMIRWKKKILKMMIHPNLNATNLMSYLMTTNLASLNAMDLTNSCCYLKRRALQQKKMMTMKVYCMSWWKDCYFLRQNVEREPELWQLRRSGLVCCYYMPVWNLPSDYYMTVYMSCPNFDIPALLHYYYLE